MRIKARGQGSRRMKTRLFFEPSTGRFGIWLSLLVFFGEYFYLSLPSHLRKWPRYLERS